MGTEVFSKEGNEDIAGSVEKSVVKSIARVDAELDNIGGAVVEIPAYQPCSDITVGIVAKTTPKAAQKTNVAELDEKQVLSDIISEYYEKHSHSWRIFSFANVFLSLSAIKGISFQEVAKATTTNAKRLLTICLQQ